MHAPARASSAPSLDDLGERVEDGARAVGPGIELLGRLGYVAKGVVYILVGTLAVQAALGQQGGQTTDQTGAFTKIASLPFGKFILGVVFVGLLGYALWRVVQAILDTEHKGNDVKGILTRTLYAGIGVIYVGLAFSALQLLMGGGAAASSSEKTQGWTAWLMQQPFGIWLVALAGIAVFINGISQLYRAWKPGLTKDLRLTDVGAEHATLITRVGRAGE